MATQFGPPIDLSALPGWKTTTLRPQRAVFAGRVSTKDQQDPRASILRQVSAASERLEDDAEFVAHFYDVESGMLPPELRGLGSSEMYEALAIPVPRAGGLQELLDQAEHRGITHVIAERSDRVARAMLTSLTVEHELEKLGVEVVYANEPTGGTRTGQLRTRRYSQVDAELYKHALVEMSMGGQIQHALAGWNHGRPPYPYITVVDEHAPVRDTSRFGENRPKKRLAPHPDPRRFDAARELCRLRREEHLKSADIIAILSAAPDRYPITGKWTHNLVEGLIANPKLTGHMVYNRKATRTGRAGFSRWNPISEWVWSPEPVHEPVVTVQEWAQAQEVTAALRSRVDAEARGLSRIRATAHRLGHTVIQVDSNGSHAVYQVGGRRLVLPTPVPDMIVQQVIEDMERGEV
ncbi:recombinase family protein [Nocardiopsis metallicus]|uniref:Resolvase/invertase-type recombinase catalytic domain-containing protein n=1 Tax=Nocardiopsis metallicus TaxID=179819 RepID=A0A840W3P1_9ACTN|nr:recombinase family protein [Nocardiopsis metallicus]MBB5491499.1 hypothetical protein [Nocardiopsis metallicus]